MSRASCSWVLSPLPLGLMGTKMAVRKQDIRDSKWQALGWKGKPTSRKRKMKLEAQSPLRCLSQQNTPRTTGCFLKAKGHRPGHDWRRWTQIPSSPTARAARGRGTAGPATPSFTAGFCPPRTLLHPLVGPHVVPLEAHMALGEVFSRTE